MRRVYDPLRAARSAKPVGGDPSLRCADCGKPAAGSDPDTGESVCWRCDCQRAARRAAPTVEG